MAAIWEVENTWYIGSLKYLFKKWVSFFKGIKYLLDTKSQLNQTYKFELFSTSRVSRP